MKRLIFIPLFLISFIVSATNYYVKNGGSDVAVGTSDVAAWETITKVNGFSFAPGDSVFFKRGDTFIGTLTPKTSGSVGAYITFGAYGTGDLPIITVNAVVPGITWTAHGNGVYKTTGIGYNPGNIYSQTNHKPLKIHDSMLNDGSAYYDGDTSAELLALPTDQEFDVDGYHVYFWDGIEAAYYYDGSGVTDTVYFRYRNGADPSDSTFHIAAEGSSCMYIYVKNYIIVQDLHIKGGEWGIYVHNISDNGYDNIIIQRCVFDNSSQKVRLYSVTNGLHGITIRNNSFQNYNYSSYTPFPYDGGTEYKHDVGYHLYRWFKNVMGDGSSTNSDKAVSPEGDMSKYDKVKIYDNTVKNCVNGFGLGGVNCSVYNNTIENTSSVAIQFGRAADACSAYNNYLKNVDIGFRFQDADVATGTNYIYRNKIYNPSAGVLLYVHTIGDVLATAKIRFYHNSFISKQGADMSSDIDGHGATDIMFVNNIFSLTGQNFTGTSLIYSDADLFIFYYNWCGGSFYGGSGMAAWATDVSNLNYLGTTFWDHSIDPPDFTDIVGTEVVDVGIDISIPFTLGGTNYDALPGVMGYSGTPDIGSYEYEQDIITGRNVKHEDKQVKHDGKKVKYIIE